MAFDSEGWLPWLPGATEEAGARTEERNRGGLDWVVAVEVKRRG